MDSSATPSKGRTSLSHQLLPICGACERTVIKATRVEAGVRYCSTCYARLFKRLLCSGCGMFKRLLASEENRRCQACVAAMPCIRCRRSGRPLGKLTAQGPACNSCSVYFLDLRPCEVCNGMARALSLLRTADGDKSACPRCLRADQRTCASCRKHRVCAQATDGRWRCRLCTEVGEVACSVCSASMPAGQGKRCQACYWVERCARDASQLGELLRMKRVRDAFAEFTAWLPAQGSAQRAAMGLRKHVEFFELLDGTGEEAWTGGFLLKQFGTAVLRRYELPVRWLQLRAGVALPAQDKAREADSRRVRKAVSTLPPGSVARGLLEAFERELQRRCDGGKLTERSMRLAFRPAVALLAMEDPHGSRAPRQDALDRYLSSVPGQRAAVSTFLGFLKASHVIELQLPPKPAATSAAARKKLEKQIAALIAPPVDADRVAKLWAPLALRYFHHLSATQAKMICNESTPQPHSRGMVLAYQGQNYWIPAEPMTHSPLAHAAP